MGGFSTYHPGVIFVWFALVLGLTMFLLHPACLLISLLGGLLYAGRLYGVGTLARRVRVLLPLFLLTALLNPLFNRRGVHILFELPWGAPVTREAVFFGLAAALLFGAVFFWFSCCERIFSGDRILFLFGRTLPALSLILTMVLRLVPRFRRRLDRLRAARQGLGLRTEGAAGYGAVFSALAGWSLTSALETADSMKCRGYGLPGRTSYAPCRWERRDSRALVGVLLCGGSVLAGVLTGTLEWSWFPVPGGAPGSLWQIAALAGFALLCAWPLLIDGWEVWKWRSSLRNN